MNADRMVRGYWIAPAAIMGLCCLLALGGEFAQSALAYQREAVAAGQWWRLLTANFLHFGWNHLGLNLLGFGGLLLLCPEPLPLRVWLVRVTALSLAVTLGTHYFTSWTAYVGFSGVLHGLFVLGLLSEAFKRDWIAPVALACLAAKVGWEQLSGIPLSDEQMLGGRVALESHAFGIFAAVGYAIVAALLRKKPIAAGVTPAERQAA